VETVSRLLTKRNNLKIFRRKLTQNYSRRIYQLPTRQSINFWSKGSVRTETTVKAEEESESI